uniref:Uncharacterized protein n=1 Tax=Anguilla anguilla TaxID=7936 RepID=A0A0E9R791_ANGAN
MFSQRLQCSIHSDKEPKHIPILKCMITTMYEKHQIQSFSVFVLSMKEVDNNTALVSSGHSFLESVRTKKLTKRTI